MQRYMLDVKLQLLTFPYTYFCKCLYFYKLTEITDHPSFTRLNSFLKAIMTNHILVHTETAKLPCSTLIMTLMCQES